jgi:hypothetical protein
MALYAIDRHDLGLVGAGLIGVALVLAEAAHARIRGRDRTMAQSMPEKNSLKGGTVQDRVLE